MRRRRSAVALGFSAVLAVSLFGGAAARAQSNAAFRAAEAGACGPDGIRPHAKFDVGNGEVEPPPAGKARVYVIDSEPGTASWFEGGLSVGMDGNWVGALNGRSQFSLVLSPGRHRFCVRVEHGNGPGWQGNATRIALLEVNAAAGSTTFLTARSQLSDDTPGQWCGLLGQINGDEGRLLLATAALSVRKGKH